MKRQKSSKSTSIGTVLGKHLFMMIDLLFRVLITRWEYVKEAVSCGAVEADFGGKTARKEIQDCEELDLKDKVQGEGIGICIHYVALIYYYKNIWMYIKLFNDDILFYFISRKCSTNNVCTMLFCCCAVCWFYRTKPHTHTVSDALYDVQNPNFDKERFTPNVTFPTRWSWTAPLKKSRSSCRMCLSCKCIFLPGRLQIL